MFHNGQYEMDRHDQWKILLAHCYCEPLDPSEIPKEFSIENFEIV